MRRTALCVVSTWVLLIAVAASADDHGGCELSIGTLVASNSGTDVDPQLEMIRRPLHRMFPFTSYRLLTRELRNVRWGGPTTFDLPGGRYLVVIPREFKDGRVSLKVLMINGSRPVVDTSLALRNRGTFLVGGPKHDSGVLIISIGARSTM